MFEIPGRGRIKNATVKNKADPHRWSATSILEVTGLHLISGRAIDDFVREEVGGSSTGNAPLFITHVNTIGQLAADNFCLLSMVSGHSRRRRLYILWCRSLSTCPAVAAPMSIES